MKGIFGSMFDLNHDGNISPLESAMEFSFLNELLKDDSDVQTELELSGLDPDELEFMDADERREALEDAGLDPDEYTGFYVNIGLDRLVMMRYGVDDVRLFHSADLRFLKQFR